MLKEEVTDLVTDQEMLFGRLILSGTMADRQAAEAAGLNPDTAADTKSQPRVRDYMLAHRAAVEKLLVEQEVEEQRRQKQVRERVLASLWKIADLAPEMTRNSASAQMKALALIIAMECLIPNRSKDGRAGSTQNQPAASPPAADFYKAAWRREQQEPTVDEPPAPAQQQAAPAPESVPATPDAPSPIAAPASVNLPQAQPNFPRVPAADFVPDTRLPFSINKRFGPRR
jgi:hypothetical protein